MGCEFGQSAEWNFEQKFTFATIISLFVVVLKKLITDFGLYKSEPVCMKKQFSRRF
jgi:1,4-alpha-glucan branching enzyme